MLICTIETEKGGSPIAVLARSLQRAQRENFDVLIVDTSGRLSNNFELIEELKVTSLVCFYSPYYHLNVTRY